MLRQAWRQSEIAIRPGIEWTSLGQFCVSLESMLATLKTPASHVWPPGHGLGSTALQGVLYSHGPDCVQVETRYFAPLLEALITGGSCLPKPETAPKQTTFLPRC